MKNSRFVILLILAIILAGAVVLRLYDLGEESLWLDECFTLDYSSKPVLSLVETLKKDVHPIGYYLPQHLLVRHFGTGEISLRILSVFFGILSVFLTYILARNFFSWKEGLLAAFFMAISYTSILYSQEAKMYSMFAAFFLLSLLSFLRFIERPSALNTIFFSVSVALLLYTHIIGFMILFVYTVFYLLCYALAQKRINVTESFFRNKTFSLRFFLVLVIIFVLYLPWLKILVFHQLPLLYNFLGIKLIEKIGLNLLPVVIIIFILLCFFYLIGLYLIITNNNNLKKIISSIQQKFTLLLSVFNEKVIFILLILFLVLDFILSRYLFSSVNIIRFGFFLLPLFYLLFSRILLRMRNSTLATILFTLFLISASAELYGYYSLDSKEQYHEAAQYIEEHASPEDILFLHRATIAKLCFDHYYSSNVEEVRLIYPEKDDHLLTERTSGKRNAYLILSHNYHTKDYFKSRFDSLYTLQEEVKFIGVTIYKYDISES